MRRRQPSKTEVLPYPGPEGAVLTVSDLTAGYGTTTVLRNVSMSVPAGQGGGTLRPHGPGRTTAPRALRGVLPPPPRPALPRRPDATPPPPHPPARAGVCP